MRGKKPIPTEMKRLAGNPGRRALNNAEPTPDVEMPQPPSHLNEVALAEWRRISAELMALKVVSKVDATALAMYCDAYARWVEASKALQTEGMIVTSSKGFKSMSPYVRIVNQTLVLMKAILVEFGMTPSSRVRLVVPSEDEEQEEFDSFLSQK